MKPVRIATTMTVAACLAVPSGALAAEAPLLSGYGGPGAGEQQTIGSGFVESEGSSSSSPAQAAPREPAGSEGARSPKSTPGEAGGSVESQPKTKGPQRGSRQDRQSNSIGAIGASGGSGPGSGRTAAGSNPNRTSTHAEGQASDRSGTLGLSVGQLLGVVLAAVGLLLVALVTWRLAALQRRRESADSNLMKARFR